MKLLRDFHVHTNYSDGKNTPEEMVKEAVLRGMTDIGISDHSFVPGAGYEGMQEERLPAYIDEIRHLQEKYKEKIRVHLGIEEDLHSGTLPDVFDYKIGSVHDVVKNGRFLSVDESPETFRRIVEEEYNKDPYGFAADYFEAVAHVVEKTGCDIIGHVDLITKFNEGGTYFDESSERYRMLWLPAVEKLLLSGKTFEINTGAISRGYRKSPYPGKAIYTYIKEHGGRFILSSDCHEKANLCFGFMDYEEELL